VDSSIPSGSIIPMQGIIAGGIIKQGQGNGMLDGELIIFC